MRLLLVRRPGGSLSSRRFVSNAPRCIPCGCANQKRTHYQYSGPGSYSSHSTSNNTSSSSSSLELFWKERDFTQRGFTVGIGGPVGSGKTALVLKLCQLFEKEQAAVVAADIVDDVHVNVDVAVVTNDIFTQEDAEFLVRHKALAEDRIRAVETGGCPHAAIREDISANLSALEDLTRHLQQQQTTTITNSKTTTNRIPLLLCESGGDNLAANFSRELADLILYVIDVAGGDKIPRKGGPGITQSDLLVINKIDLAEAVGADLHVMQHDAAHMRSSSNGVVGPTILASVKQGVGVSDIRDFILKHYQQAVALASKK